MYFSEHKNGTNIDKEFGDKKDNKSYLKWIVLILIFLVGATILYFLLNKKDNIAMQKNEIFLTLNGNTDVILYQNDTYIDPGYKAYDSKGNDLTSNVTVSGSVDTTKAGDYTVTYTLDEIIKERHISIIAKTSQKTYLILEGESTIFLKVGEEYKEPGYTVIDASETGLESKVNVSGNIGTTAGTYKLKYSVTNKSEETVSVERTIIVMDSDIGISYTPEEKTNGKVKIIVNIVDNYYDYIVLPDNSKKSERYITYEVSENGTYKFIIYSKNGEKKEKEITINNIYKNPPSGTCEAILNRDNTKVTVTAKADTKIVGYSYDIDGNKSKTISESTYQSNILGAKKVTVSVTDEINNTVSIKCTIKNNNYHEIYINADGKQCLSGYSCFIQSNYSKNVNYCSRSPESAEPCGAISNHGCGVISMSTIFSRYVKSPDGDAYDPYEVVEMIKSVCSSQCGDTAFRNTAKKFNLSFSDLYTNIVKNIDKLVELLKNDTPVLIRVGKNSVYTTGGHFMSILGLNEKGEVFLADTGRAVTTASANSKFSVNKWITIDELKRGFPNSESQGETWFRAFGPPGFYPNS